MFRNYFADRTLATPINLAVGRLLIGSYLIWKVLSVRWENVAAWPLYPLDNYMFLAHSTLVSLLPLQQWVVVAGLLLFVIGYRLRLVTVLTSVLLAHMAAIMMMLSWSGNTEAFFLGVFIMLLFALYSDYDEVSADGIRRTADSDLSDLNSFLKGRGYDRTFRADALTWSLIICGILYFGSGFSKILHGPLSEWTTAESLGRHVRGSHHRLGIEPVSGELFLSMPDAFIAFSAWMTILLEVGLLLVAMASLPIGVIVVPMIFLHATIAFVQGPVFLDMIIILLLFVSWDGIYRRVASSESESIDLVYDEHCYFCARSLYVFKLLDVNGSVNFLSQYTAPDEYGRVEGVDFEDAMCVFDGGRSYEGYYAFRRLMRQFRVFAPLVWMMGLPGVRDIGERVYRYVADNRSRHFTCAVDLND